MASNPLVNNDAIKANNNGIIIQIAINEIIYAGSSIDGANNNYYLVSNAESEYMTYPIEETIEKKIIMVGE